MLVEANSIIIPICCHHINDLAAAPERAGQIEVGNMLILRDQQQENSGMLHTHIHTHTLCDVGLDREALHAVIK